MKRPIEGILLNKVYDQVSFSEVLRSQGVSPDAIAALKLGYLDFFGDGIDSVSALQLLRDLALKTGKKWYMFKGGNDHLPKAFAQRLGDRIRYGTPVVRIEHSVRGLRVVFLQSGTPQMIAADYVICAIPFSTLKHVEIVPPFLPEKQRAIAELPYTSVARVFMQSRRRFWVDEGLSGEAATDPPVMLTFEATSHQQGHRGILFSKHGWAAGKAINGDGRARANQVHASNDGAIVPRYQPAFRGRHVEMLG